MPLRGSSVLHPSMQHHHAPVAEGGMTATVDLYDPLRRGTETYSYETGQTTFVPAPPVYRDLPARVQPTSGGREEAAEAVAQDVLSPPYLVAVPHAVVAQEGWVVHVRACPDDPAMIDRRLTVRRIAYATQRLQRDLFCEDE